MVKQVGRGFELGLSGWERYLRSDYAVGKRIEVGLSGWEDDLRWE